MERSWYNINIYNFLAPKMAYESGLRNWHQSKCLYSNEFGIFDVKKIEILAFWNYFCCFCSNFRNLNFWFSFVEVSECRFRAYVKFWVWVFLFQKRTRFEFWNRNRLPKICQLERAQFLDVEWRFYDVEIRLNDL